LFGLFSQFLPDQFSGGGAGQGIGEEQVFRRLKGRNLGANVAQNIRGQSSEASWPC
jgi:hypothetical protein